MVEGRRCARPVGLGHSRGGRTSKIHVLSDGQARPLAVVVSEGQASDPAFLVPVLDAVRVPRVLGGRPRKQPPTIRLDRAYGARFYHHQLRARGIRCVCPEREDARKARLNRGRKGGMPPKCDRGAYKGRNVVERGINRLKDFRSVATRYDKRGRHFLSAIHVVCIMLWL